MLACLIKQERRLAVPAYEDLGSSGPHHSPTFTARVHCGPSNDPTRFAHVSTGQSKMMAKRNAAVSATAAFAQQQQQPPPPQPQQQQQQATAAKSKAASTKQQQPPPPPPQQQQQQQQQYILSRLVALCKVRARHPNNPSRHRPRMTMPCLPRRFDLLVRCPGETADTVSVRGSRQLWAASHPHFHCARALWAVERPNSLCPRLDGPE
jgi:hypothetical protein